MQQTKIRVASAVSLVYMTLFKCKSWLLLLLFVYLIAALVEQRPSGQGPWCLSWRKSIMVTFTARTVVYCKVLPKTLWNWWQRDLCVELWSGKQLSNHAPHPAGTGFCIPLPWLRTSFIRIPASLLGLKDSVFLWASTVTRLECLIATGYIYQGEWMQNSADPGTPYAK